MNNDNDISILEMIANNISDTFKHKIIFSDPIEQNGLTIIPVAKLSYGYGGGSGKSNHKKGEGGGAGVIAVPVGYIEIKNGEAKFVKIPLPLSSPLMIAAGIATYFVLKGLGHIFSRKSKT